MPHSATPITQTTRYAATPVGWNCVDLPKLPCSSPGLHGLRMYDLKRCFQYSLEMFAAFSFLAEPKYNISWCHLDVFGRGCFIPSGSSKDRPPIAHDRPRPRPPGIQQAKDLHLGLSWHFRDEPWRVITLLWQPMPHENLSFTGVWTIKTSQDKRDAKFCRT